MKKILSIVAATLVILSGMHFTVASHRCCGELASVVYSFTGKKASCGMEEDKLPAPSGSTMHTDCCKNLVTAFSADNDFVPSFHSIYPPVNREESAYAVLPSLLLVTREYQRICATPEDPPPLRLPRTVDQSVICVFII